jgi:hypothetical protein
MRIGQIRLSSYHQSIRAMRKIKSAVGFLFLQTFLSLTTFAQQKQFKALLVTTTKGWHHESLHSGVLAIKDLGVKNFFDAVLFENPNGFTDKYLEQFQVVIFLNTTGDIFDTAQQKVMERFIRSGKGFAGIHSAADTEYEWDWYTKLMHHLPVCRVLQAINYGRMNGMSSGQKKLPALILYLL